MKHLLLVLIAMVLPYWCFGQFNETIRTARPGQAIGPFTLGKKVVQLQTGLTVNPIRDDTTKTTVISENTVVRFGIFEIVELSGVLTWTNAKTTTGGEQDIKRGISDAQLGGRINITQNKGAIPAIGLQGRVLLRAQSRDFRRENYGSTFFMATGNRITDRLSLTTNWGVTWSGNNAGARSLYVVNLSVGFSDKVGGFAEIYGSFNSFDANVDAGVSLLVNNDLQLDLSAGWQGDQSVTDWFIDAGLSWRWHWRDAK